MSLGDFAQIRKRNRSCSWSSEAPDAPNYIEGLSGPFSMIKLPISEVPREPLTQGSLPKGTTHPVAQGGLGVLKGSLFPVLMVSTFTQTDSDVLETKKSVDSGALDDQDKVRVEQGHSMKENLINQVQNTDRVSCDETANSLPDGDGAPSSSASGLDPDAALLQPSGCMYTNSSSSYRQIFLEMFQILQRAKDT